MTEHSASQDQPSMDDILASIRRIMDDGEAGPAPVSAVAPAPAQKAPPQPEQRDPDPDEETIFPERGGLLWRRVAGRALSGEEQEAEARAADEEAFDLTDVLDEGETDEYELNELLDEAAGIEPDDRALEEVAASVGDEDDDPSPEKLAASLADVERMAREGAARAMPPPLPADAGPAALGMPVMDRVADRVEAPEEDDDEILDLTRPVGDDHSLDEIVSAMAGSAAAEADPAPAYESVALTSAADIPYRDHEVEEEPAPEPEDSYETALRPNSGYETAAEDEARERALDARFYDDAQDFEDEAPDMDGDYAEAFAGKTGQAPREPEPQDDLDTVGGLVRDALRNRNPAIVSDSDTALVSQDTEESASRALATLSRVGGPTPRRVYGELRITDEEDAPTIDAVVREELRPMLRDWLNDNLPTVVEGMVRQEVERISARSRRFVRRDDD